jgi:1-deoxy-D-xylulose-5-phosphate synthase
VDGHDLPGLISILKIARDMRCSVVVHVYTRKGMGYAPAEQEPSKFHGIGKFDPVSGQTLGGKVKTYSDAFGEVMLELAGVNKHLCAITAAMPGGTGLLEFKKQFPDRLFDVGIAEEHAVSMAGGLAKQGMTPVVAIYSTFLQRAYDQIIQDVALLGLHVVFAIDRAGLVGEDGPTHHGVFDVGFLKQIPGMMVLCPANLEELKDMMRWAVNEYNGPVAVRYPRGQQQFGGDFTGDPGVVKQYIYGDEATVICYGSILNQTAMACRMLKGNGHSDDVDIALLQLQSPTHFSREDLASKVRGKHVFVVEEVCHDSGISGDSALCLQNAGLDCIVHPIDLGCDFVPHGDIHSLYLQTGLDNQCIYKYIREVLRHEN